MVWLNHYKDGDTIEISSIEKKKGAIWGQIVSFSNVEKEILEVFTSGCRRKIGCRNATMFWENTWLGNNPLMAKFQRLCPMSNQKRSFIYDMGLWDRQI